MHDAHEPNAETPIYLFLLCFCAVLEHCPTTTNNNSYHKDIISYDTTISNPNLPSIQILELGSCPCVSCHAT